ncbi:putative nol1 nop2 sun family protein [Erysiphe necator]|uniref:Putative nol1 nop2 sun family protein n=1 Tax=Uncinula necator TaxID=52586 RepID=A0A0B1PGQ7_UNCNE|nr:putative nol1 nop2 sun family protein [Erysiphe necator]
MSLYHETAEILLNNSSSLRSRVFGKRDLESQPAQVYALAVESCKWSFVLKEVIENVDFLRLERKVTPILSVLLVHDLLLAKRGIALPASHGLRATVEKYKSRIQSEFTKARVRRKLATLEEFKQYVEASFQRTQEEKLGALYPRWARINTLKTTLKDQLETTFSDYERVSTVQNVRISGCKRIAIDEHIPNLVALSPCADLLKSDAYKTGAIILQDKASCFPAYLLNPTSIDGHVIDTCSAPGNKTTHLAAILKSNSPEINNDSILIHAYEKNKLRAATLEKMIKLLGAQDLVKLNPGQDFLKTDPFSPDYSRVGALLLDPSCSGSGIIGREETSELHLPSLKNSFDAKLKHKHKTKKMHSTETFEKKNRKRKREDSKDNTVFVDDDGKNLVPNSQEELEARLSALSQFQLKLLLHAFKFPNAKKITYSTCSIFAQENEQVILKALEHPDAKKGGWRILKREEQIDSMRDWPIRGSQDAFGDRKDLVEACIRTVRGDEHATMGFFVAAMIRDLITQK